VRSRLSWLGAAGLILALTALPATARWIELEAYRFDPSQGRPALAPDMTAAAADYAGHGYFLVQTNQPITGAWLDDLRSAGAEIHGYVHEFAFIVGLDAAAQSAVRDHPSTSWMEPFHPAFRVSPMLGLADLRTPERVADPNLLLLVRVFRDLDGCADRVQQLGAKVLDRTDDGFSRRLVVSAPRELVPALAHVPDVWWIEEKPEFFTMNNTTRWVVQSNANNSMPLWNNGLYGEGQIATIMDSGVDYNSCWFRSTGNSAPGPSHRKIIDYSLFGGGQPYDGCDTGHGSHVAGTIVGDQSFVNPDNINYNGMAYKAKLTVQDVGADDWAACNLGTVGVPSSLASAFSASYGLGARVHSNSWGSTSNAYDGYCVDVDNAMWNRKDYLVCFAAGNSGPSGSTVGSPATAKNCVSVGATKQSPNQETIASYSSRGPASDNRYKPTVTAPGGEDPTYITSVNNNTGNPPSPTCATASSPFAGTSMATPAIAGCVLNVRQYFVQGYYPLGEAGGDPLLPSAALVKAALIAGTDDMGTADIPNNNEGWGRVLMDNSLFFTGDTRELIAEDIQPGLHTGGAWTHDFTVDSSSEPLVVTLVWTDYPGTSGGGVKLINDLDLVVTAPGGTQYKGNVFSGGFSSGGGSADRLNVEECVRVQAPATGAWTVRVSGYNVPQGPQPFAVMVNGSFAAWPNDPTAVENNGPVGPARAFVSAFPNPSNGQTHLRYAVPAGYSGPVTLRIVDVAGRTVRRLIDKGQHGGEYQLIWEGADDAGRVVENGIYFARVEAGVDRASTKIVVRR